MPRALFTDTLNRAFIPALAGTHAKNGAVAYIPALLAHEILISGGDGNGALLSEIAAVVYESEEVNAKARRTPEGEEYAALHNGPFDMKSSKSGSAMPLGDALETGNPVDVIGGPVDWQSQDGVVTAFVGFKHPSVDAKSFESRVREHMIAVRETFKSWGLDGYVGVVDTIDKDGTDKLEVAFMHWKDPKAMAEGWSKDGEAVTDDAGKLFVMPPALFTTARPLDRPSLAPGEAANVRFVTRRELPYFIARNHHRLKALPTVSSVNVVERDGVPRLQVTYASKWPVEPEQVKMWVLASFPELTPFEIEAVAETR